MAYFHQSVMKEEVLRYLRPEPGKNFIDCTLGGGGYTIALAEKILPGGKVLAIDLDGSAIENAREEIKKRKINNVILAHDNFKNLLKVVERYQAAFRKEAGACGSKDGPQHFHLFFGVVFDLGLSSDQLQDKNRGFSFQLDAPLDMNFARKGDFGGDDRETAEAIVNRWSAEKLEHILRFYGEERYARVIVRAIVRARKTAPIEKTGRLVEIIAGAVPKRYLKMKIHPATRTFQALRIATNHELENLENALPQAVDLLAPGGRIAVISYHSLEDRIVKTLIRRESRDCLCPPEMPDCRCGHQASVKAVTRQIVVPGDEEIARNPRARSAKLRVVEKL